MTKKKVEAVTSYRDVVEAIAEDIRNNPEFEKFLDGTPPESLPGDVRAVLNKASPAPVAATPEPDDAPDDVEDLYDTAVHGMHKIFGKPTPKQWGEPMASLGDAADKALVVWRDLINATITAQVGGFKIVKEDIDHAEHELGLLVSALQRAKLKLAAELAAAS